MGRSVYHNQVFTAFQRLFCNLANLGNVDLKFSGSISDVNIDNPVNFRDITMSKDILRGILPSEYPWTS